MIKVKFNNICPRCRGSEVWRHERRLNRHGETKERFRCKICNKKFTSKLNAYNENHPKCPKCLENEHVKKNGKFNKLQRYLCKKCNRSFMNTYHVPLNDKDELKLIKNWSISGLSNKRYFSNHHVSWYILKKMINKHYPNEFAKSVCSLKSLKELVSEAIIGSDEQ